MTAGLSSHTPYKQTPGVCTQCTNPPVTRCLPCGPRCQNHPPEFSVRYLEGVLADRRVHTGMAYLRTWFPALNAVTV